jgi:uncharacterized membrane protein YfcA
LPFLAAALGLKAAIILLVVPAMASNVLLAMQAGRLKETMARFWPLYLATLPGIALGVVLLGWVDQTIATRVLGVLIVLYALMTLLRPSFSLPPALERPFQVPVGLLNGLLTGLTGSQVMPLMPYMLSVRMEADQLVQAVNIAVITASAFLAVGLLSTGMMTPPSLALSVLAVVPALAGVEVGNRMRRYIPKEALRILILAVLALIGAGLTLKP